MTITAAPEVTVEFTPWPKIPRLRRDMIITEKIDGTNAAVGFAPVPGSDFPLIYAQSRKRIITPEDDNYGFAGWAFDHYEELFAILGYGLHFGEWWGEGIQRGYGLDHKRFSLFNTSRWGWLNDPQARSAREVPFQLWSVPTIWERTFNSADIEGALSELKARGSWAAPGFYRPEGIVVYHTAANTMFKVTLEGDE